MRSSYPPEPPPTDLELVVKDGRTTVHHVAPIIDDDVAYERSLQRIEAEMSDEDLRLQMYVAVFGEDSEEYRREKRATCAVDCLIDFRSGHHMKPYCQPPK